MTTLRDHIHDALIDAQNDARDLSDPEDIRIIENALMQEIKHFFNRIMGTL